MAIPFLSIRDSPYFSSYLYGSFALTLRTSEIHPVKLKRGILIKPKRKNENLIYIDTIYNPLETKSLKYLKEKNVKVFNGLDMFIYQGQKSFYLWNKINPEIDQKLIELLHSKLK